MKTNQRKRWTMRALALALCLTLCLALALSGCSGGAKAVAAAEAEPTAEPTPEATVAQTPSPSLAPDGLPIAVRFIDAKEEAQYPSAAVFDLTEDGPAILLQPLQPLKNFDLNYGAYNEQTQQYESTDFLAGLETVTPEDPIILHYAMPDLPNLLVSFTDAGGTQMNLLIGEDMRDGSLMLVDLNASEGTEDDSSDATSDYMLSTEQYEIGSYRFTYPQMENLADKALQDKINENVLQHVLLCLQHTGDFDAVELESNIAYAGSEVLSIVYYGMGDSEGAAHPVNLILTTNINLATGDVLALSDVVKVNDELVQLFKDGTFCSYPGGPAIDTFQAGFYINAELDDAALLKQFSTEPVPYYLTDDTLVLSASISHAAGDHVELSIPQDKLQDLAVFEP